MANNATIMHGGIKSMSERLANCGKMYYHLSKVSMHVICKKTCGRNHLHISTFMTQHSYWLITHLGCKLSYEWSLYIMPAEQWAQCLVQRHSDLFTFQGFLVSPLHVTYNKYKNVHIKWTEENIIRFKFRQNILFL